MANHDRACFFLPHGPFALTRRERQELGGLFQHHFRLATDVVMRPQPIEAGEPGPHITNAFRKLMDVGVGLSYELVCIAILFQQRSSKCNLSFISSAGAVILRQFEISCRLA